MTFDVQFSLEAAAELLRITEVIGSTVVVLKAAESIRSIGDDPADKGVFLSEGCTTLITPLCVLFFLIDVENMVVEVTDFRVL